MKGFLGKFNKFNSINSINSASREKERERERELFQFLIMSSKVLRFALYYYITIDFRPIISQNFFTIINLIDFGNTEI